MDTSMRNIARKMESELNSSRSKPNDTVKTSNLNTLHMNLYHRHVTVRLPPLRKLYENQSTKFICLYLDSRYVMVVIFLFLLTEIISSFFPPASC